MSHSFVKKINTTPQLYKGMPGVKPVAGQYMVSTGNQSLDSVLGGGLTVGSVSLMIEDSLSQFYGHFLKTYLAEGIVHVQKCLIVDPEMLRNREYWLKFLPSVSSALQTPAEEQKALDLKVAWRYNERIDSREEQVKAQFKYDNSKPMGNHVSNNQTHSLDKDQLLLHMHYDIDTQTLDQLWELICEAIQNNLANEEDNTIFRILLPNFDQYLPLNPPRQKVTQMIRFLRNIKTLSRATNCVFFISVDR